MSITICTPVISFPTFEQYLNQLKNFKLEFDPALLRMPTMPYPLFPHLHSPDFYISKLASQLSVSTFLNFIKAALQPMINFLGSVIAFPVVPILELSIDDLINGFDMNALIERFKAQLLNIKVPFLPDPLFPGINFPEYEIVEKIHALITQYCGNLIAFANGIISAVIDKLGKNPFKFVVSFPGFPTLPTSFEELLAPIFAAFDAINVEQFLAKIGNLSLSSIFQMIKFPGIPLMNLVIPDPFFESIKIPQLELIEMAKNYYMAIMNVCTALIKEFCDKITQFISFAFPTICITIPSISVPTITVPTITVPT